MDSKTPDILVSKQNEVDLIINSSDQVAKEIQSRYSYPIPGAEYVRRKKKIRGWDGKLKLFKMTDRKLPVGLLADLEGWAKDEGYNLSTTFPEVPGLGFTDEALTAAIAKLDLPHELWDHQFEIVKHCLTAKRALILAATSAGKSLSMYILTQLMPWRTLITVPSQALVEQLKGDFLEYGCDPDDIEIIYDFEGMTKDVTAKIVISTWQSVWQEPPKWFNQFGCIIGDEAHSYKASSLATMMDKATKVFYRFGFTGTLDGTKTHEMILNGQFGPTFHAISIKELMDKGLGSRVVVYCLILRYSDEERKTAKRFEYLDEVNFIMNHEKRSAFIVSLAEKLQKNTLILCNHIDDHLIPLYNRAEKNKKQQVRLIAGKVPVKEREIIRAELEQEDNIKVYASYGTFAVGNNVKNLHNIIKASNYKKQIRILQAIGRGMRLHQDKEVIHIYDLMDDFSTPGRPAELQPSLYKQALARIELYKREGLEYKIVNVNV